MMSPRRRPYDSIPENVVVPEPEPTGWHFTYFARDERTGLIKIGSTYRMRLMQRMRELETETGSAITLLALKAGDHKIERAYHARFKDSRVHGEWFSPSAELADVIRDANASWTPSGAAYWGEWMDLLTIEAPR
jgi:hypothetical protein